MNFSSMHVWGSYGGAETFEGLIKLAGSANFEKKTCFTTIDLLACICLFCTAVSIPPAVVTRQAHLTIRLWAATYSPH